MRASQGEAAVILGVALALAALWSAEIALRFGEVGVATTFVGALGSTSLTLGVVAVAVRRITGARVKASILGGAVLASGPVALVGAVLAAKTHHRALGGVTFAFVALGIVVLGAVVTSRLGAFAPSLRGSMRSRATATAMFGSGILAVGAVLASRGASPEAHAVADDVCVAVVLALATATVAARSAERRLGGRGAMLWAVAVIGGLTLLAASMPLRAMLAARAPVALGPLAYSGLLGKIPVVPSFAPGELSPH